MQIDFYDLLISIFGTFIGVIAGAYLGYKFAIKQTKTEIELEGIKNLAGIIAKNRKSIIDYNEKKISEIMNEINTEVVSKGFGIFLSKDANSILYLIENNISNQEWYKMPIPTHLRLVFEEVFKNPIKKYLNLFKKSSQNKFREWGNEYYNQSPLISFCFEILEYILYTTQNTLPPTEVILTKISKDMIVK